MPKKSEKNELWDNFYHILYRVKDYRITPEELKTQTEDWLKTFLSVVIKTDEAVTLYIHIFVSYLHQQAHYLKNKGLSINSFSMQSLEKQNDFTTTDFRL